MDDHSQSPGLHLCVLLHGLWGSPNHLNYLRDTLQSQHPEDGLHFLIPKSNAEYNTYDGIEVGAERITNEIEQTIEELKSDGSKPKKISVVGYSLGGLIARYAIGLLDKNGVFEDIEPVNFTTFATPHLGIRTPKAGYKSQLWNGLGARTLSTSGQQMFTMDRFRDSGRPLLSIIADPNSIFMKGLRLFKNRSLYANTQNDRSVPFYTAGISRTDPYVDVDKIDLHYFTDQEDPVILDPAHPVSPRKTKREPENPSAWISEQTRAALPFYLLFFTLMPIAIPTFLVNSAYQTYKSGQRVKLHESGGAGFKPDKYRIPLLEEVQAVQDELYNRLEDQTSKEYLPTPPPESTSSGSSPSSSSSVDVAKQLARTESVKESSPFPLLALTEDQFSMIDNLDALGFEKFPVHIQKHRHTHAAIVVRMQKDGFGEGKVVVKHWAKRFEV